MNNNRAGYPFAVLGIASLAGGIACLSWAHLLGGFGFIGASIATFLAMLGFTKFAALRRPPVVAPRSIPMPEPMYESVRAPLTSSPRAKEDAELAARLAALRNSARQANEHRIAPVLEPEPEPEPKPEPVLQPGLTVVENSPLEPELAQLFAASPLEPTPSAREASSSGLRQMDELRAEIARLREGARMRQAGVGVRVAPPGFLDSTSQSSQPSRPAAELPKTQIAQTGHREAPDAFPRTEFSGLTGEAPVGHSGQGEAFPRTEFSGLGAPPSEGSSFTKTEYLVPIELRR